MTSDYKFTNCILTSPAEWLDVPVEGIKRYPCS